MLTIKESRHACLTIVSDNNGPICDVHRDGSSLSTAWGFACLVEAGEERILFDTSGDSSLLISNMQALSIDPVHIDALVISHEHWDHVGGVGALLAAGACPVVYVLRSFSDQFRQRLAEVTDVVEVTGPAPVGTSAATTGELGKAIAEQALVVPTTHGCVVVTGCAHPGIETMVRSAAAGRRIQLVVGGFHLKDAHTARIDAVIEELQALGVEQVAPAHCTGDVARGRFKAVFGERYVPVGVGSVLHVGS